MASKKNTPLSMGISFIDINKPRSQAYKRVKYRDSLTEDSDSDFESDIYDTPTTVSSPPKMRDLRMETTMGTKIRNIKTNTQRKKHIKENKSIKDWWAWYWQSPKAHFPFLYFMAICLLCLPLCVFWLMDNDTSFIACGIIGLSMCGYGIYKFRQSLNLKKEVDKYRQLNLKFRRENIVLEATIKRVAKASFTLRACQKRLTKANNRNRKNLKRFTAVEDNMRIVGKQANVELTNINELTRDIRFKWRDQLLNQERDMLHTVYDRFERTHTNKKGLGLNKQDFEQFEAMLPKRYGKRWRRMGTFNTFAGGDGGQIDQTDFVNTLDTFALMETEDTDIAFPAGLMTPGVSVFTPATASTPNLYSAQALNQNYSIVISPPEDDHEELPKARNSKQVRFQNM